MYEEVVAIAKAVVVIDVHKVMLISRIMYVQEGYLEYTGRLAAPEAQERWMGRFVAMGNPFCIRPHDDSDTP